MLYFRDSLNINTKKTTHEIKKSTAKKADIVLVNNNSINKPKLSPLSLMN